MINTMIISAFPGCGKTYIFKNQEKLGYKIIDSDSSKFKKDNGWEKEYVDYISSNIGKYDFIFISQHEEVLKELKDRNIQFIVVAPKNDETLSKKERQLIKQQWFGRFILRDNSHIRNLEVWIKKLDENYDEWTSYKHLTQYEPSLCILLNQDEYLSDKIEYLYFKKENKDN